MRLGHYCYFSFLVLAGVAASLQGQTAAPKTGGDQPTIKSKVNVVLVDVVVTKGKGEAVSGLHRQDFQILEDGKPQTISFFEEHTGGTLSPVSLPPMPPDVYTNYPRVKTTDSVNVLLLDFLNTQVIDQDYVRPQMVKYLQAAEAAPSGARVAIFALGSKLSMVRGFTDDSSALLAALMDPKSGTEPKSANQLASPARNVSEQLACAGVERAPIGVEACKDFMAQENADRAGDRIGMTLQAFQALARYLSTVPGRKNVMWVSGSFPLSFFPGRTARKVYAKQYRSEIQQTADLLTADQVAVYPISATGLAGDTVYDPNNFGKPLHDGYSDRSSEIIAMETLARDTGGRAFYNTNDLANAMTEAIYNGSHFYTLTYTPANMKMDGKYRRIELKAVSGDYKLAYRRGYYAENVKTEQSGDRTPPDEPLIPLMGLGMPDFAEIVYKVRVAPSSPQPAPDARRAGSNTEMAGPFVRYGVDFAIASQDVKLTLSSDGMRHGNIEVMLIGYDRDGKPLNLVTKTVPIHLQPKVFADLQQVGFQLHEEIDLPGGDVFLRTGIYDLTGSNAGTLGIPLNVAVTPAASVK
jgi:VWFA-related protein